LYSSPNTIRVNKIRRMRYVRHVTHMGETRRAYKIVTGKPKGERQPARHRCRWNVLAGFKWLTTESSGDYCEHNNKQSESIRQEIF
jgi:hypothetical protein